MFRFDPLMPAQNYQTYSMMRPLTTHWRAARCEEYGCERFLHGWVTRVDESTDLGQQQAHYIRHDRSRKHKETKSAEGLTEFWFEAGQECFDSQGQHRMQLERTPVFAVKGGDWRGNPRGVPTRIHKRPEDWVEDMAESIDRNQELIDRG